MHASKRIACALMCVAALAGCQSLPQPAYQAARVPPLPAELAQKHEPTLTQRLLMLLSPSPPTATPPSGEAIP